MRYQRFAFVFVSMVGHEGGIGISGLGDRIPNFKDLFGFCEPRSPTFWSWTDAGGAPESRTTMTNSLHDSAWTVPCYQ